MATKRRYTNDELRKSNQINYTELKKWKRRCLATWVVTGVLGFFGALAITIRLSIPAPVVPQDDHQKPGPVEVKTTAKPVNTSTTVNVPTDVTPSHILACVKMKNGSTRCSGVVISRGEAGAAILSAGHCVVGRIGGKATFVNPNGSEFEATLVGVDKGLDLCLFVAPYDKVLGHAYVPPSMPVSVAKWEAVGYTDGGGIKYKTVTPETTGTYHVDSGPFTGGDSGGAIFADGGVVGIIKAREPGPNEHKWYKHIHPGCTLSQIRGFLKTHNEVLTKNRCGPYGCPPGQYYQRQQQPQWNPGNNIPIVVPPGTLPDKLHSDVTRDIVKRLEKLENAKPLKGEPGDPGVGIPGTNGKDGRGVKTASIDGGALVLEYTDGVKQTVGRVAGNDGAAGRSITGATINQAGALILTWSDGKQDTVGSVMGPPGAAGKINVVIHDDGMVVGNHPNLNDGDTVNVRVKRHTETGK